jgi:phytanoyl-CoA hydroxylase
MALSVEQRAGFEHHGFVLLERLIPEDKLERFNQRFEDLVLGRVEAPERLVVMKDVMVVKGAAVPPTPLHAINKILSFEDDPVLWEYSVEASLLAAVHSLIPGELVTISTNVFNKPPGLDGRHPLHQDLRYFALRPPELIVGAWTAIDRTTRENGCLAVIPGSHRRELLDHGDPDWEHVNHGFFAARGIDAEARVHIEMAPGDTLLFHPLLLHGSGQNTSDGFRRAISTHYASIECDRPELPRKRRPVMKRVPGPVG